MQGLRKFKEHFRNYSNHFMIIGGTGCEMLFKNEGLEFRATKDIDIIITTPNLNISEKFRKHFYNFLSNGGYQIYKRDEEYHYYYRFESPEEEGFPSMIELFSRAEFKHEEESEDRYMQLDTDINYHLSALIMDDNLFNTVLKNTIEIDNFNLPSPLAMIILKAFAWDELKTRKKKGDRIRSSDIKKHKNDILRLQGLLTEESKITVKKEILDNVVGIIKDISKVVRLSDIKNVIGRKVSDKKKFFQSITNKFI